MSIIIALALLLGGGTSIAANNAVPGDVLYPVKVNINEGVRGLFAVSDASEAELQIRLALERLEEVERLSSENRLTADVAADLRARFAAHADAAERRADQLETNGDIATAARINSDFEAGLRGHGDVVIDLSRVDSRRVVLANIDSDIRATLARVSEARANAEGRLGEESDDRMQGEAERLHDVAAGELKEAHRLFDEARASLNASTIARIDAELTEAERLFAQGEADLRAGRYAQAFASFSESIRIANHVELLIKAALRLDIDMRVDEVRTDVDVNTDVNTSGADLNVNGSVNLDLQ